ncbi:MAG: hypothetical protein JRM72_08445, partial [Nitrososphaerota archaeon]|nr:hypothetical protein [Nitrososphaerota archaeon]
GHVINEERTDIRKEPGQVQPDDLAEGAMEVGSANFKAVVAMGRPTKRARTQNGDNEKSRKNIAPVFPKKRREKGKMGATIFST